MVLDEIGGAGVPGASIDAGIEYSTWPIEKYPNAFSVSWRRP